MGKPELFHTEVISDTCLWESAPPVCSGRQSKRHRTDPPDGQKQCRKLQVIVSEFPLPLVIAHVNIQAQLQ